MEWCKKYYQEKVSTPLIRVLKKLHFTPNRITVLSHCITLTAGVYCFSRGTWIWNILGIGVMFVIGMLDYADGDLAKKTKTVSSLGVWIDSVFDVMIQNIIMGAVAIGCFKQGLGIVPIVLFYIGNTGNNLVSFYYNTVFGFESHEGSKVFRKYMDTRPSLWNRAFKNIIDPTASAVGLVMFTVRYFLVVGAVLNIMPIVFVVITVISNCRWIFMYIIFAFHLAENKKLWLFQALAIMDEERDEYYALRHSSEV